MELGTLPTYRHSGKFGATALVAVPLVGVLLGWPLGLAYAYLIKWIPFVYLNILLTIGYGALLGLAVGWTLQRCRVRNLPVTLVLAVVVGVVANYLQWSGHVHALLGGAPLLSPPRLLWSVMEFLFQHGSWALRGGTNLTGWMLAAVWIVEAGLILAMVALFGTAPVRDYPYCEKAGCWLDQTRKYETFAPFTEAEQLALLRAGDLAPVLDAKPREPGSPCFGRLLLKHSPRSVEFFTVRVENVTRTKNRKGEEKEAVQALTGDLVLPSEMRALVERFATSPATTPVARATPPPAAAG